MQFNVVAALLGGLIGAVVMTALMMMAPRMGMPEMDMPALLGSMFTVSLNRRLGWLMHLDMGMIFGVIYGLLFSAIRENIFLLGVIIGNAHWLIAGFLTAGMPMIHAGIQSGQVPYPGMYMLKLGGVKEFLGGLIGHVVYGLVVALVYGGVTGRLGG